MFYLRTITIVVTNLFATLASIGTNTAQAVTLGWTASASSDTAGYRLYYGGASHDYTNTLDVGELTTATVPNLTAGATYFFAVTAYDLLGLESAFSGEVSYTVPSGAPAGGGARLAALATVAGQMVLTGLGPAGYVYDLQTSADLQNWTPIASVTMNANGIFQVTIPNIATNAAGWYRLRQTSPSEQAGQHRGNS